MKIPTREDFKENSRTIRSHNNLWECSCNIGLWGVYAPSKREAELEGFNYFVQYWQDGEYLRG